MIKKQQSKNMIKCTCPKMPIRMTVKALEQIAKCPMHKKVKGTR